MFYVVLCVRLQYNKLKDEKLSKDNQISSLTKEVQRLNFVNKLIESKPLKLLRFNMYI